MRRLIVLSLALLGLASPCFAADQGPPDFGIDTSGTLRNLSVRDATLGSRVPLAILDTSRHAFVTATTPVEAFGAKGDSNGTTGNGTDDTVALKACAASGQVCALRPGATYRITSRVDVGDNSGFVGPRTSTIYADPAGFTHASTSVTNRWTAGVVLRAQGNASPTYVPYNRVRFEGFRLLLGAGDDTTDGRYIIGIGILNFRWAEVRGVEITGGTTGSAINVNDIQGIIADNYIHDFYDNRDWDPEQPQMLGVWVDGDAFVPAPNTGSNNLRITGNVIQRMMVGPTQYADSHWQPDGIGIANKDSRNIEVDNNDISYVGKGIWVLGGTFINIHNNRVSYSFNQGIWCAAGCQNTTIADNVIYSAGANSISTAGGTGGTYLRNTTNNVIRDNHAVRVGDTNWSDFGAGRFTDGAACYMTGPDLSLGYTYLDTGNKWINNFCDPDTTGAGINTYSFWRYGGPLQSNDWYGNVGRKGTSGVVNNPYGEKGEYTSAQGENPPVELYGAKGDSNGTTGNGTDDTAAIEACVAGGRVCSLRPGATYRLMSAIDIPSNGGLVGDKSATLYCDPTGINNVLGDIANRYLQTGTCVRIEGPAANPAGAIANVVLRDFKINWGGNSGNRCCQAVGARNVKDMTIDGLEIYNLSAAGIRYASWQNGRIVNNFIHDASNTAGNEYSGIEGDNDPSSGVASNDVLIAGNRISNMLASATGYAAFGYQPNAIKLVGGDRISIVNNKLDHTGQCIDLYTKNSVISNNTADYCLIFGISLKHSVNNNVVAGNSVKNSGNAGMFLGGDATDTAVNNLFIGNVIQNVGVDDWTGFTNTYLDAIDSICISLGAESKNNTVSSNSCDPGTATAANFNWRDTSTDRNTWVNNVVVAPGDVGEWYAGSDNSGLSGSIYGAQVRLRGRLATGEVTPLVISNRGTSGDGSAALMEFVSGDTTARSVVVGDIDKPTTTAHCWTVRTSNGGTAVERTFTCLGTVVGAPTGGTNGDMGAGTLNATGIYQNGVALAPAVASTPAPTLTFGGASTGITLTTSTRSITRDKQVYFAWNVNLSSKGSAVGVALFDGLPIAALNMNFPCTAVVSAMTAGVGDTVLACQILGNTTTVQLTKMTAGSLVQLTDADFANTSSIRISGTYVTN